MILLYDTDDRPLLLNPEYLIGAHQENDTKTVVNMVGDIVYTIQGTPEDVHDAWTGVQDIEVEYDSGPVEQDCTTCDYSLDGEPNHLAVICQICDDYDMWEGEDNVGSGDEGEDGEADVRVSGVPYAVPITRKGAGGVHD
jgi:hypothetical protein